MEKGLLKSIVFLGILLASIPSFAADPTPAAAAPAASTSAADNKPVDIYTSEMVPGADCTCIGDKGPDGKTCIGSIEKRKYKCTVATGLSGFESIIAAIVRTIVYVVMLLGVLAIVGLGIAWAWAGGEDVKMKSNLKHWGINVLVGLTILFLFRYILTFLAPWIFN